MVGGGARSGGFFSARGRGRRLVVVLVYSLSRVAAERCSCWWCGFRGGFYLLSSENFVIENAK